MNNQLNMNSRNGAIQKSTYTYYAAVSPRDEYIFFGKAPRVAGYLMREEIKKALQDKVGSRISDYEDLVVLVRDYSLKDQAVIGFCESRINRKEEEGMGYIFLGKFRLSRQDLD